MTTVSHFLVIPYPVQGVVNPLMQFSQVLAKHGCKITFLITEFIHNRLKTWSSQQEHLMESQMIKIVTLPDGLSLEDDRNDLVKLLISIKTTMPPKLHKLIEEMKGVYGDNKISCIVVSVNMGWALQVGHKLGIKGSVLFPASASTTATEECIQSLIDDGLINAEDGTPTKKYQIQLSPDMPVIDTAQFAWSSLGKIFFDHLLQEIKTLKLLGEWWLCNTTCDLEPGAFSISPKLLPIGPLIPNDQNATSFWQEDRNCLDWLDQQAPNSVIYVSFGSLAVIDPKQFKELALGLDLANRPFLWVVRPGNDNKVNHEYPDEFKGTKGKIVSWVPQKKVLNHPAIACFVSHCGWNSTIEGLFSGVPFLCWPFFSDQFLDRSYICDVWKVGLEFDKDENGVISRREIKNKVEQLLGNEDIKARSLKLKEMTMNSIAKGGQSSKNLNNFITWAKE